MAFWGGMLAGFALATALVGLGRWIGEARPQLPPSDREWREFLRRQRAGMI